MTTLALAERIAKWALDTDVPDPARRAARTHLLDSVGVALGGSVFDFADGLVSAARTLDPAGGTLSVIGRPERVGVRDAALLNGALMHGLDFDDTYMPGTIHPSASVLPAVLAMAERDRIPGGEVLAAYAVGVEVACALAAAVPPGGLVHRGFHPTGVIGAFGAVVALGRLRRTTTARLAQAQGVVGSMAAGLMEFIETGASVKRLHPGWAASSAIAALALAENDVTGPVRVHEGRFGFFATHLSAGDVERLDLDAAAASLGAQWRLPAIAIKPFPACHYIHALAEASIDLRTAYGFAPRDVRTVTCALHPGQFSLVVDPLDAKRCPPDAYAAQFSAPFVVAAAVARGQFTVAELGADALADPAIRAVVPLIEFVADPDSRFPAYFSGAVRIELLDGQVLERRIDANRGSDRAPLSDEDIAAKFRANALTALEPAATESALGLVRHIEELPDVTELMDTLRATHGRSSRATG